MKLIKLTAKNFKSYKDLEFNFALPPGLYLISGKNEQQPRLGANGAGKSTLFDALCWGIYGVTPKNQKAVKLLNRNQGSSYNVTLLFEVEGVQHTIYRSWKPNKTQLDGIDVEQKDIDRLVRLTLDQFLYTILLAQSGSHFVDLTAGEKLSFLSDIFQLDRIVRAADYVKEQLKQHHTEVSQLEASRNNTQTSIDRLVETKTDLEAKQVEWQRKCSDQRRRVIGEINELKSLLIETDLSAAERDVKNLSDGLNILLKLKGEATEKLRTAQMGFYAVAADKKNLVERLEHATDDAGKKCPSCDQEIAEQHVLKVCESLLLKLEHVNAMYDAMSKSMTDAHLEVTQFDETEPKARDSYTKAVTTLNGLKFRVSQQEGYQNKIKRLSRELDDPIDDPFSGSLTKLSAQSAALEQQLAKTNEDLKSADAKVKKCDYMLKLLPQYRLTILDEVVNELEIHFNQAFSNLGLTDWSVSVNTERTLADSSTKKELNLKIAQGEREIDLDSLSGGERQRVKLAVALGISELIKAHTGLDWNLMLWDEPCQGLSELGIQDLFDMLSNLAEQYQIFVAEHRVLNLATFTSVFDVIKNSDGNSTITCAI